MRRSSQPSRPLEGGTFPRIRALAGHRQGRDGGERAGTRARLGRYSEREALGVVRRPESDMKAQSHH
ncbi:MAG: hypothetical protein ACRETT_15580, partial [Steroidobacteraceae bacterium]